MMERWDMLWSRLEHTFSDIHHQLLASRPGTTCNIGHSRNDAFPLRVYTSFGLSEGECEIVAMSVGCHRESKSVRYSADIARSDGQVLAAFRDVVVASFDSQVEQWLIDVDVFFREHLSTLEECLTK